MVKQKRTVPNCLKHAIFGDCTLAVHIIHNLIRPVQGITAQRQINDAMLFLRLALDNGEF